MARDKHHSVTANDYVLRRARRDDLARIVEIYNATIASRQVTADLEPVSVESRVAWFEAHQTPAHPLWVAEHAGKIDAWLTLSTFYDRAAYDRTVEVSIYVDTAARRHGLASRMLREAITRAPALGIDNFIGYIYAHNTPSLTLFEKKFGFARWGFLPRVTVLDGIERDVVIVGLRISSESQPSSQNLI